MLRRRVVPGSSDAGATRPSAYARSGTWQEAQARALPRRQAAIEEQLAARAPPSLDPQAARAAVASSAPMSGASRSGRYIRVVDTPVARRARAGSTRPARPQPARALRGPSLRRASAPSAVARAAPPPRRRRGRGRGCPASTKSRKPEHVREAPRRRPPGTNAVDSSTACPRRYVASDRACPNGRARDAEPVERSLR